MRILILAALEKEISLLNKSINAEQRDDFCFAKINNNEIFTAIVGEGTLNASTSTSSLIDKIHPDVVINIGTAGGHTEDVKDGDIVVCDEAILHKGYDFNDSTISSSIKGDKKLSRLLDNLDAEATIHHGATLSGDYFTKDKKIIKALHNKYHHLCEDMETFAVYKVSQEKKIPAIAYRIISNNELLGTLYDDNVWVVNEKLQTIIARLLNCFAI